MGGGGSSKSRRKEQNQLICDSGRPLKYFSCRTNARLRKESATRMFGADAVRAAEEHADGIQDSTVDGETRRYEFFFHD